MAYGIRERAVMIALAALGGECSNAVLKKKETFNLNLGKQSREKLESDGLINSRKEKGSFTNALTAKGWKWVEDEMGSPLPPNAGSAGGALYALLAGLKPAAQRAGGLKALLASEVGTPPTPPVEGDLKAQIRSAYRALAKRPQDWVMLRDLRPHLGHAAKSEVDTALQRMLLDQEIDLTLIEDRASITSADRAAAVSIGANEMHLLRLE